MTLRFYWLFLVLCFTCTSFFAQLKIENLTHYKEFDGLKVEEITSDRTGKIWMASKNGLINFDGYEYIRYHPDPTDATTIGALNTSSVFEDRNGFIWIGGDARIYRYNPVTKLFKRYLSIYPNPATEFINILLENNWRGDVQVDIVNILGQKISTTQVTKTSDEYVDQIMISQLKNGTYQFMLSNGEEVIVKTFTKVTND